MNLKRCLAFFGIVSMLVSAFPTVSFADTLKGIGVAQYVSGEWNGESWVMTEIEIDSQGTKAPISYIDDENKLIVTTVGNISQDGAYQAVYPSYIKEDGSWDASDSNNVVAFMDNSNFDIDFRMRFEHNMHFAAYWKGGRIMLRFRDRDAFGYEGADGKYYMTNLNTNHEWHDWKIKVRGNHIMIYMDGGEVANYMRRTYTNSNRYLQFFSNPNQDYVPRAEVENFKVTNMDHGVTITSPLSGTTVDMGSTLSFTATNKTAGDTVAYYANEVLLGTGSGSDYSFSTSTLKPGTYSITAKCGDVRSSDVLLTVKNDLAVSLNCNENANYGEAVGASVEFDGSANIEKVQYYVNGNVFAEVTDGGFEAEITGLPIGTSTIKARTFFDDGIILDTESKKVNVKATNLSDINITREYQLDYSVSGAGNVLVKDGLYRLDMSYDGEKITYSTIDGEKEYDLGDGEYRVVTTSGNAEVYYNGQFAFAFLMPVCYDAQVVSQTGLSDFVVGGTGVKTTRFRTDLSGKKEFSKYNLDFDQFYSLEFVKKDSSSANIMLYDGEFELVVELNDGITVNTQYTTGAVTKKLKISNSVPVGNYRITVCEGMAQLFVDNKCVETFRCPANIRRKTLLVGSSTSEGIGLVEIKDTDDVYYHSEDFEGNIERGFTAEDYWYSEYDALARGEGEPKTYSHAVETEGENSYLVMSGEGELQLNAISRNPSLKWRAWFDSTDGVYTILTRHSREHCWVKLGYDADNGQWFVMQSRLKEISAADVDDKDADKNVGEVLPWYVDDVYINHRQSGSLSDGWHDYEIIYDDEMVTLLCDGNTVISYDGLSITHGKVGFGISGTGRLLVDDVEYVGDGKANAGISFSTGLYRSMDFYINNKGHVIGASGDSGTPFVVSEDGGETWRVDNLAGTGKGKLGVNNLRLQSGKLLRVIYEREADGVGIITSALLFPADSDYDTESYGVNREIYNKRVQIEPEDYCDELPYSGMPSRLMQIQSGPYKGRVIYCRGGSGETYGRTFMFYSDDYKDPNFEGTPSWHMPNIQLDYNNTGINIQESQMVDMPDGSLRYYTRSDRGFIGYFVSTDGGETWNPDEYFAEELIGPMCCFSIQHDTRDLNTYYAYWDYDLTTVETVYIGRPRNRNALAVSYDGMKTWEYVADIEELSIDPTGGGLGGHMNNGMRVLDGKVYMSYLQNYGLAKFYVQDLKKAKPLKRFTSLHEREKICVSVNEIVDQQCVIPKSSGEALIYGKFVYTDVNESGFADAKVVAMAVGAEASFGSNTITLTFGETVVTFSDNSKNYKLGDETITGDDVACQGRYLNPEVVGRIFGKYVSESDTAYTLLATDITVDKLIQVEEAGVAKTYSETRSNSFVYDVNAASKLNDGKGIEKAFLSYEDVIDFSTDTSKVASAQNVFDRMTGVEYRSVSDVEKVFEKALAAELESENQISSVAVSTVSGGYTRWSAIGKNSGTATDDDGVVNLVSKKGYDEKLSFGTPGLNAPEGSYNFSFDYKKQSGDGSTEIKIGNGAKTLRFVITDDSVSVYGGNSLSAAVDLNDGEWHRFLGVVSDAGDEQRLALTVDGNSVCENVRVLDDTLRGFWAVLDGETDTTVQLQNVKVYKGKAIDVISSSAEDGRASATVDLLNDGTAINDFWINEAFASPPIDFNDGKDFAQSTELTEGFDVNSDNGYMYYSTEASIENPFEQQIMIPVPDENTPMKFAFEYDLMIPDSDNWELNHNNKFVYFDVYFNHPTKAMRQTIYLYPERLKVGSSYYFNNIWTDEDGGYDGKWMSFKHNYYYEDDAWKCDFSYKKRDTDEWTTIEDVAMNTSTTKNNHVRFYTYPGNKTEFCVDNVRIYPSTGVSVGDQLIMGVYNDGVLAGFGNTDATTDKIEPFGTKRYVLDEFGYTEAEGVNPVRKFFIWNNLNLMTPLAEPTIIK